MSLGAFLSWQLIIQIWRNFSSFDCNNPIRLKKMGHICEKLWIDQILFFYMLEKYLVLAFCQLWVHKPIVKWVETPFWSKNFWGWPNQYHSFLHCLAISNHDIDGLVQDCSISSALAMEILQSCTKPSILTMQDKLAHASHGEIFKLPKYFLK